LLGCGGNREPGVWRENVKKQVTNREATLSARPAIPPRKLKSLRTKLAAIERDLNYARRASYDYWNRGQKYRSARSIYKKKVAVRELLAQYEEDYAPDLSTLRKAIERLWWVLSQPWSPAENNEPDIEIPYHERVDELLEEAGQ
jgi:hypothetical protein